MRSRYAAFVKGEIAYLRTSHDPETREEFDEDSARQWATQADWKSFEVKRTEDGGEKDTTGVVEFVANYEVEGNAVRHHEISDFRRVEGEWFFRDGREIPVTVRRDTPKVGRNDPCPCGSGKKFKKCCGQL
jgi:SEC-C motif-containing protein